MKLQNLLRRSFLLVLPLFCLVFLANCAGGDEELEDLLANNNNFTNEENNLMEGEDNDLNNNNLEEDNLTGNFDNNENNFDLNNNLNMDFDNNVEEEEEREEEEDLEELSMNDNQNPSDINLDDNEIEFDDNSMIAPVSSDSEPLPSKREVYFVLVDSDVYDSTKMSVVGNFKKGEPVVVLKENDGWAKLTESFYIKLENLSKKVVARAGDQNPFK